MSRYDNAGIRTSKTVDGVETKYTYLGGTLVSQKTGDEVINFAYSAGGAPYGFSYNGQSYFYLLDLQGDIIGIYDSNGNVVVRYTYDSWGKVISVTGSLADTVGIKNPLRYRGYYYDTETELYYLQSRYYDPETCRFINADSLLVAGNDYIQGVNMFAYCQNNPVMYSDPSGQESEDSIEKFLAAFIMFIGLGNIGYPWLTPILMDFSYSNVLSITLSVCESIQWFYDIYGGEKSLQNTKKYMSKIADMCIALAPIVGDSAENILKYYFTGEKINSLFVSFGDAINERVDQLALEVIAYSAAFIAGFGGALAGGWGLVFGEIDMILSTINGTNVVSDYLFWKEIADLIKYRR